MTQNNPYVALMQNCAEQEQSPSVLPLLAVASALGIRVSKLCELLNISRTSLVRFTLGDTPSTSTASIIATVTRKLQALYVIHPQPIPPEHLAIHLLHIAYYAALLEDYEGVLRETTRLKAELEDERDDDLTEE